MRFTLVSRSFLLWVIGMAQSGPFLWAQYWQTDWSAFQDAVGTCLRDWNAAPFTTERKELPSCIGNFTCQTVTWRGVLEKRKEYQQVIAFVLRMPEKMLRLGGWPVAMNGVEVYPKSAAQWNQLSIGTEVNFRAVTAGCPTGSYLYVPFGLTWESGSSFSSLYYYLHNGEVLSAGVPTTTIQSDPTGRKFTVTGTGCGPSGPFTTPRTFSWQGVSCTISFASPDISAPGTRYVFQRWGDGLAANPRTFAAFSPSATYTANFASQFLLDVEVSPAGTGTVAVDPTSSDGYYNSGTGVQLAARAIAG